MGSGECGRGGAFGFMKRSRLSRRLEKQGRKNIIFSIFGILFVFFALFKFGIPLLADFSLFVSNNDTKSASEKQKLNFIAPPLLNPMFNATNSANINVSGVSSPKQTIELYINEELVNKITTEDDGSFKFTDIKLNGTENILKAKAIIDNNESDFSKPISVLFKNSNPSLTIESPSDNQNFSSDQKSIEVTGKTDAGVKVTINDFWVIVDETGKFSYNLTLKDGENNIKIIAIDEAGNKTEMEKKVTYSP